MSDKKIAILTGGSSSEREISLESGQNIHNVLLNKGFNCELIDYLNLEDLKNLESFDRVFIAMHGYEGESGSLQKELTRLGIKFTGSNAEGCENTWNKDIFKQLLIEHDLPTPKSLVTTDILNYEFPSGFFEDNYFFLKPVADGSSLDTFEISSEQDFESAKMLIKNSSQGFLLEESVKYKEFTVAILQDQVLPVLEIKTPNAFYDYDAKYISDKTIITESELGSTEMKAIQDLAMDAFMISGCSGWGRVDILQAEDGSFYAIEINTVPGMTSHSLFPKAASLAGISSDVLLEKIMNI